MNNTSCIQPKVVQEPKIPATRGKEWQRGVGTLELLALYNVMSHYDVTMDILATLLPIVIS